MGYFDALLRYFEFSGRSSRGQYWIFQLCYILLVVGAFYLDYRGNITVAGALHPGLFLAFVVIFHAVPQITIAVRRLHDVGRSGWWWPVHFVPLGGVLLLVWSCYASEPGTNEYGEHPHEAPRPKRPTFRPGRSSAASRAAQQMLARMAARRDTDGIAS